MEAEQTTDATGSSSNDDEEESLQAPCRTNAVPAMLAGSDLNEQSLPKAIEGGKQGEAAQL